MKRKLFNLFLVSSFAAVSLLSSCSQNVIETTDEDDNKTQTPELYDERTILISDIPTIMVGETLDLDKYVSVKPGINETLDEKNDLSYNVELLETSGEPSFEVVEDGIDETNSFLAIHPGIAGFLIESHGISKTIFINAVRADEAVSIENYFQENTFDSYTVERDFTLDESLIAQESETSSYFYKTPNYEYDSDTKHGYVLNNGLAYYCYLEDIANSSSFVPAFYENKGDQISENVYQTSFEDFSEIFKADNINYSEEVAEKFGEEYAYGISTSSTGISELLNDLGINATLSYYGYNLSVYFVTPIIENDSLSFYVAARYNANNIDTLIGPYKVTNVNNTKIDVLDEVTNNDAFVATNIPAEQVNNLNNITSYTSTVSGRYIDKEGNEYKVSDLFETYLPSNLSLNVKVDEDSLEFSNFNYIEKGVNEQVRLSLDRTDNTYHEYVYDEKNGTYQDEGSYLVNNQSFSDYKTNALFSSYVPKDVFTETNLRNVLLYQTSETNFKGYAYYNTSLGDFLGDFISLTSAPSIASSTGPLMFYIANSTVDLNITADEISGTLLTEMLDSGNTFYYEYTFSLTNLNNTNV